MSSRRKFHGWAGPARRQGRNPLLPSNAQPEDVSHDAGDDVDLVSLSLEPDNTHPESYSHDAGDDADLVALSIEPDVPDLPSTASHPPRKRPRTHTIETSIAHLGGSTSVFGQPSYFSSNEHIRETVERIDQGSSSLLDSQTPPLPLEVDLREIQLADQYNGLYVESDKESIPLDSFEAQDLKDISTSVNDQADLHGFIPMTFPGDDSEMLPHKVNPDKPNKFRLALTIWCEEAGLSRPQYKSLLEILRMPGIDIRAEIENLPLKLSTLKYHGKAHMPLLTMRRKAIPLNPDKLRRNKCVFPHLRRSSELLYFFEPLHLFHALASSDIIRKLHLGVAHWVDSPNELWNSHSWASSIRSTSGEYAHYPNGKPIFPSDFVRYQCHNESCSCKFDELGPDEYHLGRICSTGRDLTSDATVDHDVIMLEVQSLYSPSDVNSLGLHSLAALNDPPLLSNERILSYDMVYVSEENIKSHVPSSAVFLDYTFKDRRLGQHHSQATNQTSHFPIFVRRVINGIEGNSDCPPTVQPLCRCHPSRAELELETYGREYLESFDSKLTGRRTISLPLLTFIDGFGLYRNNYRTLMGMYVIPAGLSFRERARRANVFPITLGPHGSNFGDVVDALKSMAVLDRGVEVQIGNKKVLLCAYTHAYIGDMPQQQENAGFKSQAAKSGCRFCFIKSTERGNLTFDIHTHGRYHKQTVAMRHDMDSLPATRREKYSVESGLDLSPSALVKISPALDLILTRPSDPAHSEYQCIAKTMHLLLLEAILTPPGCRSYADELRRFPFPPGWPRVQSPIHHLKSYSLAEHARWALVVPVLLRCWLRDTHIQPLFAQALGHLSNQADIVRTIVECYAIAAKSHCFLMGNMLSSEDRNSIADVVIDSRTRLQTLLLAAAKSRANPRRSRSVSRVPVSASTAVAASMDQDIAVTKKAEQYLNDMKKPNMHIALHYSMLADEYGLPSNCNVLIGEDKHRYFKAIIYQTNHLHPEADLLLKQNIRQTIRFGLAGAFRISYPHFTQCLQEIQNVCPELFASILTKSEFSALADDDGDVEDRDVRPDKLHRRPSAIGCIQATYCIETLHLPTRASHMQSSFRSALTSAYGSYYGMPNILQFRNSTMKWYKKFTFTDPETERSLTFKTDDCVQIDHSDNLDSVNIARIDQILVHNYDGIYRLFILATRVHQADALDEVLGCPILRLSSSSPQNPLIVGLPGIRAERLYIVPFEHDPMKSAVPGPHQLIRLGRESIGEDDSQLLWVQRSLQWL